MKISYRTGGELLLEHYHELVSGQTKIVLFYLATQHDHHALMDLAAFATDLNDLTGPFCTAVAFMPPSTKDFNNIKRALQSWRPGMLPNESDQRWADYERAMTYGSYEVARYFGVSSKLPCLLFVSPEFGPADYAVISLKDTSLKEIYPSLRLLFGEWYAENPNWTKTAELKALASSLPVRDRLTEMRYEGSASLEQRVPRSLQVGRSNWVRNRVDQALRSEVLPLITAALQDAVRGSTRRAQRLASGVIRALVANPRDIQPLNRFLFERKLKLEILGVEFSGAEWSFDAEPYESYNELYSRTVVRRCQRELQNTARISPFPLERVAKLSKALIRQRVRESFVPSAENAKTGFSWILEIIKLLPWTRHH